MQLSSHDGVLNAMFSPTLKLTAVVMVVAVAGGGAAVFGRPALPGDQSSAAVPAPQATLMATLIKGLLAHNLDWQFVMVGVALAVTIELCGVSSLSFAVGGVRATGREALAVDFERLSPHLGVVRVEVRAGLSLAVELDLLRGGRKSFRELVDRTRQACLDAYAHDEVPFERLVDELHLLVHPVLFVQRDLNDEITERRVEIVQDAVTMLQPKGPLPEVVISNMVPEGRPADIVSAELAGYRNSAPTPRVGGASSGSGGSSSSVAPIV
jgi:hypothetical protein